MIEKAPGVIVELVKTLFTKRNRMLLWSSLLLVLAVGWLGDSIHEMLSWIIEHNHCVAFPRHELVYVAIFIMAFWFARRQYHKLSAASSLRVDARSNDCDGLVLFLSKAYGSGLSVEQYDLELLDKAAKSGGRLLLDKTWRKQFDSHLRMPLEALAFHFGGLAGKKIPKRVTVLASLHSAQFAERVRIAFVHLLEPLAQGVSVITIGSVGSSGKWQDGADYSDPHAIASVIEAVYADHERDGIPLNEVIVDATGGMGLGSVIASMTALKAGRRVEFTSSDLARENYTVRVFDFEYTEPVEKD